MSFRRTARTAAFAAALLATSALFAAPDIATYPLGANIVPPGDGGGVVFRVWAPNAISVHATGQFNSWSTSATPMTLDAGSGIWSVWVPAATSGQEYKFYPNRPTYGTAYKNDPYSRDTINTTGNSIIRPSGTAYNWQATGWQTPDKNNMVIYQLHVGTFSGNGDGGVSYPGKFRDVVDLHLNHLKDLGVNMVKILPVHEFPATSWGYNPVHFFAPESDYGTPDDFRYMVDTLHQNGIGVLLDVVYNHTSNTENNLWDFDGPANIYFFGVNCAGSTPWGDTRPKYTQYQVSEMIRQNVTHWMTEYRLDGIRVDATAYMRGYCGELGEGWLLTGDLTDRVRAANPRGVSIAEELPNNSLITTPRGSGGAGYDMQWVDNYGDVMRAELAKYNSAALPDVSAIATTIVNTGWGGSNAEAIRYVESHDEAATTGRTVKIIDSANPSSARAKSMAKVSGALTILSPGTPMLLMGQEFLEDKNFGDGSGDRIWWGFMGFNSPYYDFFARAVQLRTTRGSLLADSGVQVTHVNNGAAVLAFQRYDLGGDVTHVVANMSATNFATYNLGFPQAGTWYEVLNSDRSEYSGGGVVNGTITAAGAAQDGLPTSAGIKLPPYSILAFSQTNLAHTGVQDWILF
ncbi:MAG: alpha-amylase family glycosyl hydrolase [Candidatus Sumerlaeia bacterium]|nr:alpha-amylase family glycosyl hydrolase [Candidatus Sumerlaeia bacterium]